MACASLWGLLGGRLAGQGRGGLPAWLLDCLHFSPEERGRQGRRGTRNAVLILIKMSLLSLARRSTDSGWPIRHCPGNLDRPSYQLLRLCAA
jgi:hypothetical protein